MEKSASEGGIQKLLKNALALVIFFWLLLECLSVFSRYILQMSIAWNDEILTLVFVWLIFIGCALASADNKHIEISVLTDALHGRAKIMLKLFQNVCMLAFVGVLVVQSVKIAKIQMSTGQFTAILGLPVWFTTLAMIIGGGGWFLVLIWKIVGLCKALSHPEESKGAVNA